MEEKIIWGTCLIGSLWASFVYAKDILRYQIQDSKKTKNGELNPWRRWIWKAGLSIFLMMIVSDFLFVFRLLDILSGYVVFSFAVAMVVLQLGVSYNMKWMYQSRKDED